MYDLKSEKRRAKHVRKFRKKFFAELQKQLDPVMFAIKTFNTPDEVIAAIPTLMKSDGMYATFIELYQETGIDFATWIFEAGEKKYPNKTKAVSTDLKYTWTQNMINYVLNEAGAFISTILLSSGVQALRLVQLTVAQALDEGLSIPSTMKLLEKRIPIEWRKVSKWRSELIARTEVLTASNKGVMMGADSMESELGIVSLKQWSAKLDSRVRADHAAANGQKVNRNIPFMVGGRAMMQPGDPNGGASQRCNCRCAMKIIVDDQSLIE
jgi:hypothetical protein